MKQTICDRCRKIITDQSSKLTITIKQPKIDNTKFPLVYYHIMDLCETCSGAVEYDLTKMFGKSNSERLDETSSV